MTTPRVTVPVEPLWMMHVIGPDDLYPAPDHATAVQWSAYVNREIAPRVPEVLCVAVPAIWTGTAEEHADELSESVKGWSHAAPEPEGGAVEFPYQRTFNAIADAVTWHPNKSFGISVEAFQRSFNASALATREEAPAEAGEPAVIKGEGFNPQGGGFATLIVDGVRYSSNQVRAALQAEQKGGA